MRRRQVFSAIANNAKNWLSRWPCAGGEGKLRRVCEVDQKSSQKSGKTRGDAMYRTPIGLAFLAAASVLSSGASAADAGVARGEYLVTISGCNDCHTPGYFFGKPDDAKFLGGSDVGFEIPGMGVFVGRNITPDKETGIGSGTKEQIVAAIQTGRRPDGRELAPIMPWHAFAQLTPEDANAIATFLQSVKPVSNKVPDPVKPGEKATTFMFRILPPGETAAEAPK
jgi:mono/diheme cytochrome c family protein